MEAFSREYRSFIENHIYDNFFKLKNTDEYSKEKSQYNLAINKLYDKLTQDQKEEIENIANLQSNLHSLEIFFCYNLGMTDGIKIENYISKS